MTAATAEPRPGTLETTKPQSEWALVWARLRTKRLAMLSLVIIAIIYGAGITAPWLAPYGYSVVDLDRGLEGPSADHWLGTDENGFDVFSRLVHGARASLGAALAAVTFALLIGVPLGLCSGWYTGLVDSTIMRAVDVMLAFPSPKSRVPIRSKRSAIDNVPPVRSYRLPGWMVIELSEKSPPF